MEYLIEQIEKKNIFQNTLDDLSTQLKFVGTFGFGITGLYETVHDLLQGRYPSLDEQEIILIFLVTPTLLNAPIKESLNLRKQKENAARPIWIQCAKNTKSRLVKIKKKVCKESSADC